MSSWVISIISGLISALVVVTALKTNVEWLQRDLNELEKAHNVLELRINKLEQLTARLNERTSDK